MSAKIPSLLLNNGCKMPLIGFGTAKAYKDEIIRAVGDAIEVGYRHIDGAPIYGNEVEVGQAIRQKMDDAIIDRKDLFIVSKLWCTFMSPRLVEPALRMTLKNLQLDYLDLYLMHWPMAFEENPEMILDVPFDENGRVKCKDVDYVDTWKAMEACVRQGLVRSIGVSNFNSQQLKRLLENCAIKPVTNQVEAHVYLNQKPMIELCREYGIVVTAYSPLGRPSLVEDPVNEPILPNDPQINEVAVRYRRTVAQILLRYLTMQGVAVIPKSSNRARMLENLSSLDFDLAAEDMAFIDSLNRNHRFVKMAWSSHHHQYPFNIPY
ncbi:hypothetical protein DAPPUDRAFT_230297 [Daphnia pulex]|uniref:NADP-dependent oxidoreductase domain-containing protein n=1 Tax=Daphnia pulex TaxID=6669 RepID=E9FWH8_DAPPU|nr:hypothetical protein DAPPUDRAFT_230297 [Daphnia pulex]|eukprot:EFX88431.1 hypothetical protein DAPPUDRAFT_230297 [Daphnia pulex]